MIKRLWLLFRQVLPVTLLSLVLVPNCMAQTSEPFIAMLHSWLQTSLSACVNRADQVMGLAGFTVNRQAWYVEGRRPGLQAFIHCHQHSSGSIALTVAVAGSGEQGQNRVRDYLRDQMLNQGPVPPASPPTSGAACNSNTLRPLLRGVYFPQSGQPVGFDYSGLRASSAAECCQKCRNARFPCKSFIFNSDPRNNVCYPLNVDTCSADPSQRLVLKPDRGNPQAEYFEVTGCTSHVGGSSVSAPAPGAAGICSDPRTLAAMDEWLNRAIPPQNDGDRLRYDPWGRQVGSTSSATIRTSGPPDTSLSRCDWLWQYSSSLRSSNNLGTLREYVSQRLR